jgi:N-hydroxyarylamine O-acetyltransferase
MDLASYLQRAGFHSQPHADQDTLTGLHAAHLHHVPFENLSIGWGEPIVLDEARHYDKIVTHHRGGFCYELNGLAAWALREIGYEVSVYAARVWSRTPNAEGFGPPFSHLLLCVHLDVPTLFDVGFGDSFTQPKRLVHGEVQQEGTRAWHLMNEGQTWTLWMSDRDASIRPAYQFDAVPRAMHEFAPMCRFHQSSAESHFTRSRVCTRLTAAGRITLTDGELISTAGDGTRHILPVTNDAQATALLDQHFGIRRRQP